MELLKPFFFLVDPGEIRYGYLQSGGAEGYVALATTKTPGGFDIPGPPGQESRRHGCTSAMNLSNLKTLYVFNFDRNLFNKKNNYFSCNARDDYVLKRHYS